MLRTPLADDHLARGATLAPYHGAEVPLRFGELRAEHCAARTAAGVFDFSFRSKFTLTGEHRARFLHRIVSNDVKSLTTGQGVYATLLSAQGRILADLRIYADEDRLWVDTDADLAGKAMDILRHYIIGDRVEITPAELFVAALQGPGSRSALQELLGNSFDRLAREMDHQAAEYEGQPARVVCLSSTGEEGYEVWLAEAALKRFWLAAVESGATPCGSEALEILRIEAGIPRYGPDLGEDTLALEADLLSALSFNKGCYIGQEIVERTRSRGHVNWKLMGLRFDTGAAVPALGEQTTPDGKRVAEVTSACFSPTLGRPVALAYLRREFSAPGSKLPRSTGDTVEVVALPFVVGSGQSRHVSRGGAGT